MQHHFVNAETYQDCRLCGYPESYEYGVQSHGGDLFQHSQWTALNIDRWTREHPDFRSLTFSFEIIKRDGFFQSLFNAEEYAKHDIQVDDVGMFFIILCAFFHDIGKGGDGIYDMYAEGKYGEGTDDSAHPEVCAKKIINPERLYHNHLKTVLDYIFQLKIFVKPDYLRRLMAMTAHVHWEFGKLNIPLAKGGWQTDMYVKKIFEAIDLYELGRENRYLIIRICMMISTADIAAGANHEIKLSSIDPNIKVAEMVHRSLGGPWANFAFNVKYNQYMNNVLTSNYLGSVSKLFFFI